MVDEYNIVTGSRSAQFLGRKARSAVMRVSYIGGNAREKLRAWQDLADTGVPRGLILVGSRAEGIFAVQRVQTRFKQEINGVITQIIADIDFVEDGAQQLR